MIPGRARVTMMAVVMGLVMAPHVMAQSDSADVRPLVAGGADDRSRLTGLFGRIALGGYLEANGTWEREDGATTELGFELTRWNLLASTSLSDRVRVFSEVEFEEGGEEVIVELAQLDLLLHRAVNLRGGLLLLPLGRYNLTHDGPRNELPRRPVAPTELLGVVLSQPGLGAFGDFTMPGGSRQTYELYTVTGFRDGVILESPEGTRLSAGRRNFEDANASPAFVGRTEWSPSEKLGIGLSGYHGAWNSWRIEGVEVEERQDLTAGVLDAYAKAFGFALSAEGALVEVDVPDGLTGLFASRQYGFYAEASHGFGRALIPGLPDSWFTAAARVDAVDFDRDLAGDSFRSITLGLNFRPLASSVIKLAWMRGESRDRFNNLSNVGQVQLGLASYF
ncbi:MAG TPA: hypothetical protein VFQ05_02250 [Candidatus Eisenbacteria bacterium]|nr:hypothetical protein [Candidatus Eisenbacteria bacterium]